MIRVQQIIHVENNFVFFTLLFPAEHILKYFQEEMISVYFSEMQITGKFPPIQNSFVFDFLKVLKYSMSTKITIPPFCVNSYSNHKRHEHKVTVRLILH